MQDLGHLSGKQDPKTLMHKEDDRDHILGDIVLTIKKTFELPQNSLYLLWVICRTCALDCDLMVSVEYQFVSGILDL